VLELALRDTLSRGHNHIGTKHILLGLVRHESSNGLLALASQREYNSPADVTEKVRVQAIRTLCGRASGPRR
jgi:ATP-dependent Clp protease ATP-binding subunit ClpC